MDEFIITESASSGADKQVSLMIDPVGTDPSVSSPYQINGTILDPYGNPISGMTIEGLYLGKGAGLSLGNTVTNDTGYYLIIYDSLLVNNRTSLSLGIRVPADHNKPEGDTKIVPAFEQGKISIINHQYSINGIKYGQSEFAKVSGRLSSTDTLAWFDNNSNLSTEDLIPVASEEGITQAEINAFYYSRKLNQSEETISQQVFYGLR
ncbi:MAG: carboxypeptidase-like regulatory domain-containing protein, partial [Cyclobacteriaceae bacterium]